MSSNIDRILVAEYLESLTERDELDYILGILLDVIGFEVLARPEHSKGQSQYGKDLVAILEKDGEKTLYFFEVKGGNDRNINDNVLNGPDGIINSFNAAKYTPYKDASIPSLGELPIQYILVHNGSVKENTKPTLDGFVTKTFPDGNFERWGIEQLTKLFSEYLFNEYLLAQKGEALKLLKKVLLLMDTEGYEFKEFNVLIDLILENTPIANNRAQAMQFCSLNLILHIIYNYSNENENLVPAKNCSFYLVLKFWDWILENQLEENHKVIKAFDKVLETHYKTLKKYFDKTLPIALLEDGLFSEQEGFYESIGYPARCYEYVSDLTYFYRLSEKFNHEYSVEDQINTLCKVVNNNSRGFTKPLLDNHSIGIMNIFLFLLSYRSQGIDEYLMGYLAEIFKSLIIIKVDQKRFPEVYNRVDGLIKFNATGERPSNYTDESSLLILTLFEMTVVLNQEGIYQANREFFTNSKVNLQRFDYDTGQIDNIEKVLFKKEINEEGDVETGVLLDESFEDFCKKIRTYSVSETNYKTKKLGYEPLLYLAHNYFKTPFFPEYWKEY